GPGRGGQGRVDQPDDRPLPAGEPPWPARTGGVGCRTRIAGPGRAPAGGGGTRADRRSHASPARPARARGITLASRSAADHGWSDMSLHSRFRRWILARAAAFTGLCYDAGDSRYVERGMTAGVQGITVAVARETAEGERRVAATPETCKKLVALGAQVQVQRGAGLGAGFIDETYVAAGARVADDVPAALGDADLVLCVQPPSPSTLAQLKQGAALVGTLAPQADAARGEAIGARQLVAFPLERLPRT